jgi:hypothetical protein
MRGDGSQDDSPIFSYFVYIFMPMSIDFYDIYFSLWLCFHLLSVYDISIHFTQTMY